jgi:hypothetical protein
MIGGGDPQVPRTQPTDQVNMLARRKKRHAGMSPSKSPPRYCDIATLFLRSHSTEPIFDPDD